MILYSSSARGFFHVGIHSADQIPADAVPVTDEEHEALLAGQSAGKQIEPDENGHPVLVDPHAGPAVPRAVTRRQARLALLEVGKLDDVEAAIEAITDPVQRRAAQIEYDADTWERDNEFLQAMWAQLGGTEQDLDDLFILAASK